MMEEPYELPEGWVLVNVGDVIEKISTTGKKLKQSEYQGAGKLPVIDQGKIFIGGYTDKKELKVCCDLPVIVFGDHTKVVKYINFDFVAGADGVKVIKPIEAFNPKIFYYFLQATPLPEKGYARHFQYLEKSFVPLPPHSEQYCIVAKLETLLAQVNTSKDHLANVPPLIKRFRQSVLAAACSGRLTEDWRREHPDVEPASELLNSIREERIRRYGEECRKAEVEGRRKPKKPKNLEPQEVDSNGLPELPEGWVWCKLEDILNDFQPGFACGARDDRGYVQLRMNNIGLDGKVVLEKTLKVPIERTNMEKYDLRWGDLLFNNTNSVELIGKTALFRDEVPNCVFSNHITRIRPDIRLVNSEFLLNLFIDDYNKGVFRMMCHRFVGQAGISREKLLEHILPLPPLLEQHAIVARVEELFKFAEVEQRVAAATTHANQLTKSILAKAFRGELVPQDPNDEPASVLLERIKKERAKQEKEKKAQKRKSKTLLDFN